MRAGEVADVLCRGVDGELDHVGAFDEFSAGKVVVLGVFGESAVVEDQEAEETSEAVKGPHGHAGPDPGVVHSGFGEL